MGTAGHLRYGQDNMRIDLPVHPAISSGKAMLSYLLVNAAVEGFHGVAIIDFDTTGGFNEVAPNAGLQGSKLVRGELLGTAKTLDLRVTGSNNFHGTQKPNRLGENSTKRDVRDAIPKAAMSGMKLP